MNMPILLYFAINQKIAARNKRYPQNSMYQVPPSIPHIIRSVQLSSCTNLLFYPNHYRITSAPLVPFWPCLHQKRLPGTSFGLTKTIGLNMKHDSKLPGEKGYVYHPERILDYTLFGSPPSPQINGRLLFTGLHPSRK